MLEPWVDTVKGVMWTYPERDKFGRPTRSVRNDALWEAKMTEREGFVKLAQHWMLRAIYDGWTVSPTYDHEPQEHAFTLEREGYKILGLARPGSATELPCASIHIWGPDRLAIKPPLTYDWGEIRRNAETCSECGAHPVATERVGFAGRYCATCAPAARKAIETPGWCD